MPIERGRDLLRDLALEVDVAIVGTGAGGGMALATLARRGLSVVALEEGPWLTARDMTQHEAAMMTKLYQERGARSTADLAIRVLGGRSLGGSTVHNINLCKRAPPEILEMWRVNHRVSGLSERELGPVFDAVEKELSVTPIPAEWRNANNRVLERGVTALGWRGGPLNHNRVGCQRIGFCEIGCPYDAKQNAAKLLVTDATSHGAHVLCDARVERIEHAFGKVRGLTAVALDERGNRSVRIDVAARAVVLAGSAIGSAALAHRSGLPDPHDRLGRNLTMHPGVAVAGLFDEKIEGWKGIPQSYECTEFLDYDERGGRRVWITTAFAHPIGTAVSLPGFGRAHREWMLRYPHLAVLTAMVHDHTRGRVRARADGRATISYRLSHEDARQLALGIRACARLLFAGGARKVLVPSVNPLVLEDASQIDGIPDDIARPHQIPMAAVHPMGTLALGDDPRQAVVESTGQHHQMRGLFVLDGSLFPTSLGAPPQITIYAMARYLSRYVEEHLRGG
jgi:choline dehydrogenase-like flavoprotein